MKEWLIYYWYPGDAPWEERVVVLPSSWGVFKWLVLHAFKCKAYFIRLLIDGDYPE